MTKSQGTPRTDMISHPKPVFLLSPLSTVHRHLLDHRGTVLRATNQSRVCTIQDSNSSLILVSRDLNCVIMMGRSSLPFTMRTTSSNWAAIHKSSRCCNPCSTRFWMSPFVYHLILLGDQHSTEKRWLLSSTKQIQVEQVLPLLIQYQRYHCLWRWIVSFALRFSFLVVSSSW